jgi:hypothetical protein
MRSGAALMHEDQLRQQQQQRPEPLQRLRQPQPEAPDRRSMPSSLASTATLVGDDQQRMLAMPTRALLAP